MDPVSDPYDDAREDVDRLFKEAEALRARLKELVGTAPLKKAGEEEAEWVLKELAPCLADLDENVTQLAAAVQVAERQKSTFKVDAAELGRRKDWLQAARGRLLELHTAVPPAAAALKKAELWDTLKHRVMLARAPAPNAGKDPVARIKATLGAGPSHSAATDPKGKGVVDRDLEAHNEPYDPNEKLVTDQLEVQRMQLSQQDEDLDVLHGSIKRLGQVGLAIREELGQQSAMLDELDEESGALQSKLRVVQRKMDKVAADLPLKTKLCVIFVLACILLFLLLVLLYT